MTRRKVWPPVPVTARAGIFTFSRSGPVATLQAVADGTAEAIAGGSAIADIPPGFVPAAIGVNVVGLLAVFKSGVLSTVGDVQLSQSGKVMYFGQPVPAGSTVVVAPVTYIIQ